MFKYARKHLYSHQTVTQSAVGHRTLHLSSWWGNALLKGTLAVVVFRKGNGYLIFHFIRCICTCYILTLNPNRSRTKGQTNVIVPSPVIIHLHPCCYKLVRSFYRGIPEGWAIYQYSIDMVI